jgi:hypothetical protein
VGQQRAIKGFFSGFYRGMQAHRVHGDEQIARSLPSQSMPEGISQAEFRSWLQSGKTIDQGIAAKLEAERIRRETEERQEYERQRRKEADQAQLLWPFKALGVLFGLAFLLVLGVLVFWALLSGIRWLWEHPLW